jgi:hypothetical protein
MRRLISRSMFLTIVTWGLGCSPHGKSDELPQFVEKLAKEHHLQVLMECEKRCKAAKNDTELFTELILAISRGMLSVDRTTLEEVRKVFGDRLTEVEVNVPAPSNQYVMTFQVRYPLSDGYQKDSIPVKGVAQWRVYMNFSDDDLLVKYYLTAD